MFGKSEWFQASTKCCNPLMSPTGWQGWTFYLGWIGSIIVPTVLMLGMGKIAESLVWLAFSGGSFAYDHWQTKRQVRKKKEMDSLYFIGEEESQVSTRNYEFHISDQAE